MKAMAATLRQAVPHLIDLSPTLTEALTEAEATIQTIGGITGAELILSRGCARELFCQILLYGPTAARW
jgi:hypothetical protein